MKKTTAVLISFLFSVTIYSQTDSLQAPYKRFPQFPALRVLLPDSTTRMIKEDLPKKKPVMLMVFSPACEHCQQETEEILKKINKFEKITIVMITMLSYKEMMLFREAHGLSKYRNIIVGQDKDFFLPPFFDIKNLPFLAFYDKKKNLISVFSGSLPIDKALEELEK